MSSNFSKRDESFRAFALHGSIGRVLLSVCGPLMLYNALQQIFRILDSMMASHISATSVSAVAYLSQLGTMINALGFGLAIGGCIKVSVAYGQGDFKMVQRYTSTLYVLCSGVGLLLIAILLPGTEFFLRLFQTPEALIAEGSGYFQVSVVTMAVSFFNTVYIAIERSRGHAKKLLFLNLGSMVVKLSLSALFVYVLHGDVTMIAVATLISDLTMMTAALIGMYRDEGAFRFSWQSIHLRWPTIGPVLNLSYPLSAENMFFAMGKVVINSMSKLYGPLTVGALGLSNNIGGLTTCLHAGTQAGATGLISQNRGAGKYGRTLSIYYRLLAVNVALGAIGLILVYCNLNWLAGVFASAKSGLDPAFQAMIVSIHQYEMLGYITLGINSATLTLLIGYGYSKLSLALNVARVFVFRVPVLWALQQFTTMGTEAVGVTMMVSNVCSGLAAICVAIPVVMKIRRMADTEEADPDLAPRPESP